MKNIMAEIKKTFKGIDSILVNTGEWVSGLDDRILEITQ